MFDISQINWARSKVRDLILPIEPSEDLAYFCGLMAGDGHIAVREQKADYYLTIEGNPFDERELYYQIVKPLVKQLFNIDVTPKMFDHTFGICIRSRVLIEYLTGVLGLPKGRKYSQLRIPTWIKSSEGLLKAYIRGLADTDFCLSLKKRYKVLPYYPVITGCSESKSFMEEIARALESLGLPVSRHFDYKYPDSRLKAGWYVHQRIHLNGHENLVKWMSIIGFQSPKHLKKFRLWQDRNESTKRLKVLAALKESRKISGLGSSSQAV